ncbi:RIP metalloprotease RseP [Candidatus Falkowbacteria bacterium RIFOXYD2_FULL_35_9]|uniref:Zinc metalloprotease n=1 Tax=Candidatus Falkowbacteria bacterium RIFOXYC2_FULL_36_12 TaxID=1798002 RepID=A0A1F5T0F5_9BACT|nr:MAG: RIP metalloprotease RseP [Candidatus Falkowbacteria bacterium RIFOXYB2_FULL_35_7]OGF32216.1 MAG: RIP metalloprotease RseP [Candidatus Falkowbacteria bacterium RIFOXYC2_FULL_36_12]OGF33212.1 MAG: RIP metalloprotease RseP [Candidatus Falkowbacteria bacterium RIFOXYA2_FULL_35_8]OGF48337.1 MAG: RIP metalloprotease RseP [Candidatus Falkowbacteria bacterium RIFOXYD2_FULL_35_9]
MFITIIIFILILGLLVFVHELGHYVSSKKLGVKAEEFGFGIPPRIFGWKKINGKRKFFWGNKDVETIKSDDTIWSLNWLPLGGFVKIKGEDGANKADNDSFASQKAWKRVIILSAGVLMNFVLAAVLLAIAFNIGAPQVIESTSNSGGIIVGESRVQILQVVPDSPADKIGLQVGDVIVKINNEKRGVKELVQKYIAENRNQDLEFVVERFGEEQIVTIPALETESSDDRLIGVALIESAIVKYPWYTSIWLGIKAMVIMTGAIIKAFALIIRNLFIGMPVGVEVAGPVGIAVLTGQAAKLGLAYLLQFAAILSINLGIINFMPFPALDGGRVLFILIEKIRRKPISQKIENAIHAVGFFLLIFVILLVTIKDLKLGQLFGRIFG